MRYHYLIVISLIMTNELFSKDQSVWLTIFIHGSIGLRPYYPLNTFIQMFQDKLENSPYKEAVENIRDDHFFYKNQPIQARGLLPINADNPGANLFAKLYDISYKTATDDQQHHRYYTFGWSGLISHRMRYVEARILYHELRNELEQLAQQNIYPKIRIIGYSHGGNVALNLAAIRAHEQAFDTFEIDELILLGTPIQKETDFLICSDIFKRVINIYSRSDHIQKLDCFSMGRFFSNRQFGNNFRFKLPAKLTQIEIKIKTLIHEKDHRPANRSPGHVELWFFGWPLDKRSLYRSYFPLNPLPFALFIPPLLQTLNPLIIQKKKPHHFIVEWCLNKDILIVRQRHRQKKINIPFVSSNLFTTLQNEARNHQPVNYTAALHRAHIKNIVKVTHNKPKFPCRRTKGLCAT